MPNNDREDVFGLDSEETTGTLVETIQEDTMAKGTDSTSPLRVYRWNKEYQDNLRELLKKNTPLKEIGKALNTDNMTILKGYIYKLSLMDDVLYKYTDVSTRVSGSPKVGKNCVCISNSWLKNIGVYPGQRIKLTLDNDRIIIEKAE